MIKKQVVSLELSQKLKDAGYPQEGVWWWVPKINPKDDSVSWGLKRKGCPSFSIPVIAPTIAELVDELPAGVYNSQFDYELAIFKNGFDSNSIDKRWFVVYEDCITDENRFFQQDDRLSNALAKMWLYLKENNLLQIRR